MIKTLQTILRQDRERFIIPKGVQEIIPVNRIWSDGIFKSGNPAKRAASIVKAVTNYTDAKLIAELSADLGEAMVGINEQEIALLMAERGK